MKKIQKNNGRYQTRETKRLSGYKRLLESILQDEESNEVLVMEVPRRQHAEAHGSRR
jgi:hypothetical protein